MALAREMDQGTLRYDIFFNDDESEAVVYEEYESAEAHVQHFENMGENAAALFAIVDMEGEWRENCGGIPARSCAPGSRSMASGSIRPSFGWTSETGADGRLPTERPAGWRRSFLEANHGRKRKRKMDHSMHEALTATELTSDNLVDATVYGPGDEKIGSVAHLHGTGASAQVVVDAGGFLGIGAKPVALPVSQLNFMRDEDGAVHATTTMTKDQVKALPEHHD